MQSFTKQCTVCHKEKPLSDFPPNNNTKTKVDSWCRECHRIKSKERYRKQADKRIQQIQKWQAANPDKIKKYKKKYSVAKKQK